VSGLLGAITHALEQLDQDEIRLNVLHEGAGDITDNDIMLASASDAIIVGFNTKITETARRAAESEGVDVRLYDIIYKLTDDIDAALKGLLEPRSSRSSRAAPRSARSSGRQEHGHRRRVRHRRPDHPGQRPRLARRQGHRDRPDRSAGSGRVREVAANYECGIGLANFHDLEEGDIIECVSTQTVSRVATA
jgi:translation initiation factor IF-2